MNIDRYKAIKAWPFQEALRILEKINYKTPEKGYVLFETGYGPSGLPHIGTFGEVVRTKMVMFAFSIIAPEIPTRIFCISDDMDGMRKIPDNVPNKDMLKNHINKPLTEVPDPFETSTSYGHNMNARLRAFLDSFGFEYEFKSATDMYKNGDFNEFLVKCAENYQKIMDIMIPTLGDERAETYSPFMPIDQETRCVMANGVVNVDPKSCKINYTKDGKDITVDFRNGGCKLQWKPDFGMRWAALGVDYEIYGKDHLPNEPVYRAICEALGKEPPVNFFYELFLDKDGKKISKSKGNGIAIEEWLKYAPIESLGYYMYVKPRTAKRLYFDVIPKSVDEYLKYARDFQSQNDEERLENPATFVHFGDVPKINFDISFDLLINISCACSPDDSETIWGFIKRYDSNLESGKDKLLDKMVECALNYYNDFVKPNKSYKTPNEAEKIAILTLKYKLEEALQNNITDSKELQDIVYSCAHENNITTKDYFILLYNSLLGMPTGPRMGSFIALFGVQKTIDLIEHRIN